jgi:hypothetical protein
LENCEHARDRRRAKISALLVWKFIAWLCTFNVWNMLLRAPPDEENALRRAGAGTGLAGLPRPAVAPRGRSADQILIDAGARPI